MPSSPNPTPVPRPGGRSARIQQRVFAATLAQLERESLATMSVKRIAEEAEVAETTVYRRWGSLVDLVLAAVTDYAGAENPIPDTGSLEADLGALLDNVAALLERDATRRMFGFAMVLEGSTEPASRARSQFWGERFTAGSAIVARAVDRGEIAAGVDPLAVIETLVGAVYVRAFVSGRESTPEQLAASVRAALDVARSQPAGTPPAARDRRD